MSWTRAELVGYVETRSALRGLAAASGRAPVEAFHAALAASWGPPHLRRTVRWPLSLYLARL